MNQYFRAGLNVKAAFSSYCLGDYEGALRLISEVPGEKHADTPILGYKILYLCALGSVRDAAQAARQYVVRFCRLPTPHRQALSERGIDADSLYLTYKYEGSSIRSSWPLAPLHCYEPSHAPRGPQMEVAGSGALGATETLKLRDL